MMNEGAKYYIISDVHGDEDALEKFYLIAKEEKPDLVLITGDLCPSSPYFVQLLKNLPCAFRLVRGNCDSVWDFTEYALPVPKLTEELTMGERVICMTHGHSYFVDNYPYQFKKGDIFIYGHTHRAELSFGTPIVLNPGSLARPRGRYDSSFIKLYQDRAELFSVDKNKKLESLKF